jgi:hypothetical protein
MLKVNAAGTILLNRKFQPKGYKTYINDLIHLEDGNILGCGFCVDGANTYPLLLKTNPQGILIPEFGDNGYVIVESEHNTRGMRIAESDDALYLMGNANGPFDIKLFRFYKNGTINPHFAQNGVLRIDYANKADAGAGLHWLGNDTLLVTGTTNNDFAIWKIDACTATTSTSFDYHNQIQIMPNPFRDHLSMKFDNHVPEINGLELHSLNGDVIWNGSVHDIFLTESTILFQPLSIPPGVYVLRIQSGNRDYIKKIVKID